MADFADNSVPPDRADGDGTESADDLASRSQFDCSRWALDYAARGWAVLPLHSLRRGACTCSKGRDCSTPGKHPRTPHGVKDATTDPERIRLWWSTWPDANVAIATGQPSGVVVVDVDPRNGGTESWDAIGIDGAAVTLTALTGGGGRHYFFRYTADLDRNAKPLPGVDFKSTGGYVAAAPSRHASGGAYSWLNDLPVAEVPVVVQEALQSAAGSTNKADLLDPSSILRGVPEGERNETLFRYACQRRRMGLAQDEVAALVLMAARASNLPDDEALVIVASAFRQDHPGVEPWMLAAAQAMTQAVADDRGRLHLQTGGQVRGRPRPPYLIEEVLPEGALFQIFGATGQFKSFVVLDMLASVANGVRWMGKQVTDRGLTALVLGEGGADAGTRVAAWLEFHQGLSDDRMTWSIEEGLDLQDTACVDQMIEDLLAYREDARERLRDPDADWKVIVFDTQADHMPNGDEDKSKDFTVVKRSIQRIAQATGAAVGLVHHTGWDDSRERGSSRQRQALDVVMQVKDGRITNEKQKFGPKFSAMSFVTDPVGESLVVRLPTMDEQMAAGAESLDDLLDDVRALLRHLADGGKPSQNAIKSAIGLGKPAVKAAAAMARDQGWLDWQEADRPGVAARFAVTPEGVAWLEGE